MCKSILKNIFCNDKKKSPAEYIYEWAKAVDAELEHLSNDVTTLTELVTGEPIDLETLLASKADAEHTHEIESINLLQDSLDAKVNKTPSRSIEVYLDLSGDTLSVAVYENGEEISFEDLGSNFVKIDIYNGVLDGEATTLIRSGIGICTVTKIQRNPSVTISNQEISCGNIILKRQKRVIHGQPTVVTDWELVGLEYSLDNENFSGITKGKLVEELKNKTSLDMLDDEESQEAHLEVIAEGGDVRFAFILKNGEVEKSSDLTLGKMDNFNRAISNPDATTPVENSDNLITSGAVYEALARLEAKIPVHQIVTTLPSQTEASSEEIYTNKEWILGTHDFVLETERSVKIHIDADVYQSVPEEPTPTETIAIDIPLTSGQRVTANVMELLSAQATISVDGATLNFFTIIPTENGDAGACLITVYSPTSNT